MTPFHALAMALALTSASAHGGVVLRGAGQRPIEDAVRSVTIAGVTVEGPGGVRTLGWDVVKSVTGDYAAKAAEFTEISDKVWRARIRLARGDYTLAEPLFDELFEQTFSHDGPTPLVVAEGLLRCRLERGVHAGAVVPWLESLRLTRAAQSPPPDAPAAPRRVAAAPSIIPGAAPVIDPSTGLIPALPPISIDAPWAHTLANSERLAQLAGEMTTDPIVRSFAAWRLHAARLELGLPTSPPQDAPEFADHPGVRLVASMVRSRSADAEERSRARAMLDADLPRELDTWREAWRRVALGRSLLMEDDAAARSRGLLHLLHLPARFGAGQSYVVGMALAEASVELARLGRTDVAERLRDQLLHLDPQHPGVRWLERRLPTLGVGRPPVQISPLPTEIALTP